MIEIGRYNALKILRDTDPGLFLGDSEDNEVLLPNRYVPDAFEIAKPDAEPVTINHDGH